MNQQQSFELLQIYFNIFAKEFSETLWKLLAECFHLIKSDWNYNSLTKKAIAQKIHLYWQEYLSNNKTKLEQEVVAKKEYTWRNDS